MATASYSSSSTSKEMDNENSDPAAQADSPRSKSQNGETNSANEVGEVAGRLVPQEAQSEASESLGLFSGNETEKHRRVSSPLRSAESDALNEATEATDTESAYEEGWSEDNKLSTESGEETDPVVEASYVNETGEGNQEFFGLIASLLPTLLPVLKPLIQRAVPAVIKGARNIISPAIRKLPAPSQSIAKGLLDKLLALGLKVKLETGEEGGEDEATATIDEESAMVLQQQIEAMEVVIGPDDRIQVSNPSITPYKRICHLSIKAANNKSFLGTGFFIGPRTILTAGHCVHMKSQGGWVKQIIVTPGRNADSKPFGSFTATKFRSVVGWVNSQERNYDYGVIQLDKSHAVSSAIGAYGFGFYDDMSLMNKFLNNAGYPGDQPSGTMWRNGRKAKSVTQRTIVYDIDTAGGQSGSPVWIYRVNDGKRIVVGIHTNGSSSGNSATRITKEVFDNLVNWRNEAGTTY